jgi:hypothetical protein
MNKKINKPQGRPPEIGETRDKYVMAKCTTEERDRWNKGAKKVKSTVAAEIRAFLNRMFR